MSETPQPATDPPKTPPRAKGLPNLAVRLLTAAIGIPIIMWMLFRAPPIVFSALAPIVAAIGAAELGTMTLGRQRLLQSWMIVSSMAVSAVLTFSTHADAMLASLFGVVVGGALAVLAQPDPLPQASARMGWLIAGPLYIGGAIAAIAKLHHLENGGTWVLLSMALAWGSDTGGYFAGRALGRHKLYEKISPKKTMEGAVGGLLAAVAFALVMRHFWLPELPWAHAVALALVAGAFGQAGDLCISVIKRSTGVKDSGHIIPGHGGLLDRVDALMFTAIVTLLYAQWVLGVPSHAPSIALAS